MAALQCPQARSHSDSPGPSPTLPTSPPPAPVTLSSPFSTPSHEQLCQDPAPRPYPPVSPCPAIAVNSQRLCNSLAELLPNC